MSYNDEEYQEAIAQKIESAINTMSLNEDKLALAIANRMHRTNQQAFTRVAIAWLKVVGGPDYRYDGRNEASAIVCRELVPHLNNIYLPFI